MCHCNDPLYNFKLVTSHTGVESEIKEKVEELSIPKEPELVSEEEALFLINIEPAQETSYDTSFSLVNMSVYFTLFMAFIWGSYYFL